MLESKALKSEIVRLKIPEFKMVKLKIPKFKMVESRILKPEMGNAWKMGQQQPPPS